MNPLICLLAVTLSAHVINGPEAALEPSLLNEVEHALSRAPSASTNEVPQVVGDVFATNGLSATAVAIRLVSTQGGDGRWTVNGTNFTHEAVSILRFVSGLPPAPKN